MQEIPQWAREQAQELINRESITHRTYFNAFARYIAATASPPIDEAVQLYIKMQLAEGLMTQKHAAGFQPDTDEAAAINVLRQALAAARRGDPA